MSRRYPAPLREYLECDYAHRLPPAERAWLARFTDELAGCFRAKALHRTVDQQRAIWRDCKAAKQDAMSLAKLGGILSYPDDAGWEALEAPEQDWLVPREDMVHAAAVARLKSELPPEAKDRRLRVRTTPGHAQALRRLVDINRAQQAGLSR